MRTTYIIPGKYSNSNKNKAYMCDMHRIIHYVYIYIPHIFDNIYIYICDAYDDVYKHYINAYTHATASIFIKY